MGGEIIEQSLDDLPNPSVLILGHDRDSNPLHITVGIGDDKLWLITAYYPTHDLWEADYKTRRVVDSE